jgi:hypothetical protein
MQSVVMLNVIMLSVVASFVAAYDSGFPAELSNMYLFWGELFVLMLCLLMPIISQLNSNDSMLRQSKYS